MTGNKIELPKNWKNENEGKKNKKKKGKKRDVFFFIIKKKKKNKIIKSINYNKTKSKHVLATAKILIKDFNGKVPNTLDELLTLPGVGRKVGNVYLAEHKKEMAIGVDTHVGRISQKLGWRKNKHPHKIEKDLEILFQKKYWRSINYICVRFGRSHTRKEEDKIFMEIKKRSYHLGH